MCEFKLTEEWIIDCLIVFPEWHGQPADAERKAQRQPRS
jgi:hypothetical protein